ncbi:MAG: hypothetical protein U0R51_03285 [Solirubrobacterales bacterium]
MPNRVYVIELERGAGRRRDPRIPWVYVGSSARDAEIRFAQHRRGYRSSGLVKRFALRLRPDLYEDLPGFRGAAAGRRAELDRARELAACGFVAHSDGTSYGKGEGAWSEWDADRLALVGEHADRAALELAESSFTRLDAGICAALLHGDRGFWVADHIDPTDPPPAYGLFAHVAIGALRERVAAAMAATAATAGIA